ncbi:hypothetical protein HSX37_19025|nr:hypothetical protein [Dendrosporobacter quercicolus]NSL50101.1 hypothetical protein [Dendrosporobacter quercicolus DSM 1736]
MMTETDRSVACITNSMADLRETEEALFGILDYVLRKNCREDFSAEEWEEFILCCQQLDKLEHSMHKVKAIVVSWYQAPG